MRPCSLRRWFVPLAIAALVATGCDLDEAELLRPGAGPIRADVGQLRVLGYDVDPATDEWVDVLSPDGAVVTEVETFRETDAALLAEGDEPGDRRRLFRAVGEGRTLLVELNCGPSPCDGSGPAPAIQVWEFVVAGADLTDGTDVATPGRTAEREVGEYVVIVGDRPGSFEIVVDDGEPVPIRAVATHAPASEAGTHVEVFAAVRPGRAQIRSFGGDQRTIYDVEVTAAR